MFMKAKALFPVVIIMLLFIQSCQAQGVTQWEPAIKRFEEKDGGNASPGAILFTGSSSIAKWQDVGIYFPGHRVLNRGFGGSQFSDLLYYLDRVVMACKPSKVFIYEGDNDLAAGESPEAVMAEARQVRERIAKALPGVHVVFISVKPSPARWELKPEYVQLNRMLRDYAAQTDHTEFADVWAPMLDEKGHVYKHIFVSDSLHMNAGGYAIWKQALLPYMN